MFKLLHETTIQEKIEFFVACQTLLAQHHPTSPFIFTASNQKERIYFVKDFINNYKGFCYQDVHVCALFNHILINNPHDPIAALKTNMYQPPNEHFNALSIDFVVFRAIQDCGVFCRHVYKPQAEFTLFVKNNRPKIYKTTDLLTNLLRLPKAI